MLFILVLLLASLTILSKFTDDARVPFILLIIGNIGSYVGVHKDLNLLSDEDIGKLAKTWTGLLVPSLIGGILSLILYLIFLSGLLQGDLFPQFEPDAGAREGFDAIFDQHAKAGMKDYAKLLFWGFVAGFNQKYVVDIIDSIKSRGTPTSSSQVEETDDNPPQK